MIIYPNTKMFTKMKMITLLILAAIQTIRTDFCRVLAYSTITSTPALKTIIDGDICLTPGSAITGAPRVLGNTHINDAISASDKAATKIKYDIVAVTTLNCKILTISDLNLIGILSPGCYIYNNSSPLTGTLKLHGDGEFTFKMGNLLTAAGASIILGE